MSATGIREGFLEAMAFGSTLKDKQFGHAEIGRSYPKVPPWGRNRPDRSSEARKHSGYEDVIDLYGVSSFS